MGFQNFHGNAATVRHLREGLRSGHFPQALILAGPKGAGKYTLALMLAKAVNCLERVESDGLPDFCGHCSNCVRIAESANLEERVAEAVAARDEMRDADKRETRVLIQTHPDVLIVPPDPPQLLIKMGQVRAVIHAAFYRPPAAAHRAFTIFTTSAFMKEAANSLLKVLEEPPERTSLILLTENPHELLPTIRSRAVLYRIGALPVEEIEMLLAERRPELKPQQRALAARLAEGAVGCALKLDLETYLASRQDALTVLRTALREPGIPGDRSSSTGWEPGVPGDRSSSLGWEPDYSQLFRVTETYRGGADGQEKTINLLRAIGSLLEDLLLVLAATPQFIRNVDLAAELERMAQGITVDWISATSSAVVQVEQGMRRNLLRSLSLDAMAVGVEER